MVALFIFISYHSEKYSSSICRPVDAVFMQNRGLEKMSDNYDCCTHYRTNTYSHGYIMLKCLPVKICDNCGEVQADNWSWWQVVLDMLLTPFWNGKIMITEQVGDMGRVKIFRE